MTKEKAIKQRHTCYIIFLIIMTLFFVCKALEIYVCVNTLPAELKADGPLWITCAVAWVIAALVNYTVLLRKNYDDYSKDELRKRETELNSVAAVSGLATGNYSLYFSSKSDQDFANSQGIYKSARIVSCTGILICGCIFNILSFFYSGAPGDTSFTYFIVFQVIEFLGLVVMCKIENTWRKCNTYIATGNWYNKGKSGIFILYAILFALYYGPMIWTFASV